MDCASGFPFLYVFVWPEGLHDLERDLTIGGEGWIRIGPKRFKHLLHTTRLLNESYPN
jgi:hypothetical protein